MLVRILRAAGIHAAVLAFVILAASPPIPAQESGAPVSIEVVGPMPWKERARLAIDGDGLTDALAAHGYRSQAYALYLVEIVPGVDQPAFVLHEAGAGAFWNRFYPLSAVKLTAAVAAIDWVARLGFTGDALVRFDGGYEATLAELYEQAITVSSNAAYDRTLQIAGLDYLNQDLIPRFGLDSMWLGAAYAGSRVQDPPGYVLAEEIPAEDLPAALPRSEVGSTVVHSTAVPGRRAEIDYRAWNDTDLFDLVDVMRRVMLDDELPYGERYGLPAIDVSRLQESLCRATPDLLSPGIARTLGDDTLVCNKSGTWPTGTCVDHAYAEDPATGRRFLMAAVAPCNWPLFASIASQAVEVIDVLSGTPIQEDAGRPIGVLASGENMGLRIELFTDADWALVWIDDRSPLILSGDRLDAQLGLPTPGSHLMVVIAMEGGTPVGYRSVGLQVTPLG